MDYTASAKQIIEKVGGKENIVKILHCSTRLRFSLADFDKVDLDGLKQIDGVLGAVIATGQCQVIIGNNVVEMFDEVQAQVGQIDGNKKAGNAPKQKWYEVLLDFVIGIFQPLVPAIAGSGVLKSLLMLFALFGWVNEKGDVYQVLNFVGSAPLYFLPLLVAITTAQKLNVNVLVAVSTVSCFVYPDMVTALGKGINLFGMGVNNITYSSQVFPAILTVLFYALLEKYITKYCPKPVRIFLVPLLCMAITVPVTLLILGPLGYVVGEGFTSVILFLFNHFGWIATAILAAVLPLMVATGMHKAMIPYAVSSMSAMGKEVLYLPASLAHNISECGTCFAIALKTKDEKVRATAISAGISALFGITEPALYGITLQNKRALLSVMISSLVCGGFIGILAVRAFALVGPGIASLTMYVDKNDPSNLVHAIWGFVASIVVSFILGYFLWSDQVSEEIEEEKNDEPVVLNNAEVEKLVAPVEGKQIALKDVNDTVFSSGVLGEGVAFKPTNGQLKAPIDGEITMVYETGHAVGMKTMGGSEILFHIGLDTVQLKGKYFDVKVKTEQMVKKGDVLVEFDLDKIKEEGFDPTVIMVITQANDNQVLLPVGA